MQGAKANPHLSPAGSSSTRRQDKARRRKLVTKEGRSHVGNRPEENGLTKDKRGFLFRGQGRGARWEDTWRVQSRQLISASPWGKLLIQIPKSPKLCARGLLRAPASEPDLV